MFKRAYHYRQWRIDFTQGKMLKNIILFTIPGLIIAVIQLVIDNVGMVVIGQTGTVYQAAVGAGGSILGFGLGFLIHIANGGGLAAARKRLCKCADERRI